MSFDKLLAKVEQAEDALEARERQVAADFRVLGSTWRETLTPTRIVIAGALAGFLVGRGGRCMPPAPSAEAAPVAADGQQRSRPGRRAAGEVRGRRGRERGEGGRGGSRGRRRVHLTA